MVAVLFSIIFAAMGAEALVIDNLTYEVRDDYIVASLSDVRKIRRVNLYLQKYDDNRTLPIRIALSDNGVSYTQIYYGTLTSADGYMASVDVSGEKYKYISVTVDGSSIGSWCSVTELQVFVEE